MSLRIDLTRENLAKSGQVPMNVDEEVDLEWEMAEFPLECAGARDYLLTQDEKGYIDISERDVFKDVKIVTISNLTDEILGHIFLYLDKDEAARAAFVCRKWHKLNTYPFGQLPVKIIHWGKRLQSRLYRETFERTSYAYLKRQVKEDQLVSFSPFQYHSAGIPVSVSEVFVRSDAVDSRIVREKSLLSQELKFDPYLKGVLEEIFIAEKAHAEAYQPFYHAATKNVFFFGFATKMLLEVLNKSGQSNPCQEQFSPIHWFRFPQLQESNFPHEVQQFLREYPMTKMTAGTVDVSQQKLEGYNDHDPDVKQWLLSVSPFLFSNINCSGESTWELFLLNKSVYPPDNRSYFNALCDHFHLLHDPFLRERYAQEFENLTGVANRMTETFLRKCRSLEQRMACNWQDRGNRDLGILFQIFVPKPLVDYIVYPCREYGLPRDLQGRKISGIYKEISADPTALKHVEIQARMLTGPLVTPGNQIKVMTHGHRVFFESPEGKEVERIFQAFFLNAVMDSQVLQN